MASSPSCSSKPLQKHQHSNSQYKLRRSCTCLQCVHICWEHCCNIRNLHKNVETENIISNWTVLQNL